MAAGIIFTFWSLIDTGIDHVWTIGCVACPLRAFLSADDISKIFQVSNPKLVIAHPNTVQLMWDAMTLYGKQLPMLVMATKQAPTGTQLFTDFLEAVDDQQPLPHVSPDAAAHLLCTSGTTGPYKLVNGTWVKLASYFALQGDTRLILFFIHLQQQPCRGNASCQVCNRRSWSRVAG